MLEIQSVQNPTVKRLKGLKDKKAREEAGEMLVEGEKLMLEAAGMGLTPSDALIEAEEAARFAALAARMEACGARVYAVSRRVLEAVCDWGDEGRFGAARVSREYLRGILKCFLFEQQSGAAETVPFFLWIFTDRGRRPAASRPRGKR